jgi:phosphate/sulfate permease
VTAVIHGIVAWFDAYGIGANDVANAFGTSVGELQSFWAADSVLIGNCVAVHSKVKEAVLERQHCAGLCYVHVIVILCPCVGDRFL